jgi:hypothetical protein
MYITLQDKNNPILLLYIHKYIPFVKQKGEQRVLAFTTFHRYVGSFMVFESMNVKCNTHRSSTLILIKDKFIITRISPPLFGHSIFICCCWLYFSYLALYAATRRARHFRFLHVVIVMCFAAHWFSTREHKIKQLQLTELHSIKL